MRDPSTKSSTGRFLAYGLPLLLALLTGQTLQLVDRAARAAPAVQAPPPAPPAPAAAATPNAAPDASPPEERSYRILFQEEIYQYSVFAPRGYRARSPGPAILLLHGAGGNAAWSIAAWKDFANEKGILLIAPTVPYGPQFQPLIPTLLRSILAEVERIWKPDPHRVYLFGHSAGGVVGFDVAMLDADRFAAAAIHAAVIYPDFDWILGRAKRKTPIALYIGDRDQFFPVDRARRTRDILQAAGFPLRYVELPGHDHDYHAVAAQVNRDAWDFLSQYSLPN
jgi:predicted esterase